MKQIQMEASVRTGLKKNEMNRLRDQGRLPAVLYGEGKAAVSIQLEAKGFEKQLTASGVNVLIQLNVTGGNEPLQETVTVKEIQRHPVTGNILHVDFLKVSMDKPIETTVPIHIIGVAPGTKEGGMLSIVHRDLHIRCLPALMPESIDIDVTRMHIGDSLTIKDVDLAEGIDVHVEPNEPLVQVVAPRVDKAQPAGAADAAPAETKQPEVIGEKEREERRAEKSN